MATLATQKIKSNRDSGNPIDRSLEKSKSKEPELKDLRLALAYKLQSTLELEKIIDLFFEHLCRSISCSGICYEHKELSERLNIGTQAKHSAAYNISSKLEKLGSVKLSRDKPFLSTELIVIELFIGSLFFPLRNALLYKEAIANSMRDPLTGIGNRSAMDAYFEREVKLARRQQTPLSILILDIDHFKKVNDTFGHSCGDTALKHTSRQIKNSLRETDQVFRYGGEEFVALLNGADIKSAQMTAERIRSNVASNPIIEGSRSIQVTLSAGVSTLHQNNDDAQSLFVRADRALYKAKNNGRNRVMCDLDESTKGTHSAPAT